MASNEGALGVSSCLFKNILLEYTEKAGLPRPVYEFVEDGPSHDRSFWSTVVVNGVKYYSIPGFSTRKAAQQSAAEVALMELARSSGDNKNICTSIHESGTCKTMLLRYAEKMNYAAPIYESKKDVVVDKELFFSSTVEIGGTRYTGGAARTRKEAEIKAASAALLAIHPSSLDDRSRLTLFPARREIETVKNLEVTPRALKAEKAKKKKKATQNISGVLQTLEGQSVVSKGDQSNLSGLKETPSALKPKKAKCKKRKKKMATPIPSSVLGTMEEARVEGTPTPHTNSDLQTQKGQSVGEPTPNSNGELPTQNEQSSASNRDQIKENPIPHTNSDLQTPEGQSVGEPTPNTNGELPTQKEQSAASNRDQIKETTSVLKEETRHVEGAPTPHDNGELTTLKGQAVASSGDQINQSGLKETPSALKPKKAKCKKRKGKMATQISSTVLGLKEARVEGTPTPHTNGELQTPKGQSVCTPILHINDELQTQKEQSVAPDGHQSNPSGLGETPPSALKPKKARRKKKMATQNLGGELGTEEARHVEDAPAPHTNSGLQTPKGQPVGTPTPHTNEELQTLSVASNGDQSNPSGLKETPGALKPKMVVTPTPHTNEELPILSVASNDDQNNPSGFEETPSALKSKKAKCKKKKTATQNPSGVLGTEEASRAAATPTPHTISELQTQEEQSVASNGNQGNPLDSGLKLASVTQNPSGVLGTEEARQVEDAPAPHTNTELQTPKGQSLSTPTPCTNEELQTLLVASNADQSNRSGLKETPNAPKPKKAKCKKKKTEMATHNPSGVLGMEADRAVATPTPHTNSELQTQEEQSVASNGDQSSPPDSRLNLGSVTHNPGCVFGTEEGTQVEEDAPAPYTNSELQAPKRHSVGTQTPHTKELQTLSVASNGDQSNPSGLKETPSALKPKKAKCKKKKKLATQNPSGVLGMEEASRAVVTPTPHTNSELQTQEEQSVASNGNQSNPPDSGLTLGSVTQNPSGVLGTEEARWVEDVPAPHNNSELQTLSVASNGDQSNLSGLKETPSALKPKKAKSKKKKKMATQNPIGVFGMEEASRLQTQVEQSVATHGDRSNPPDSVVEAPIAPMAVLNRSSESMKDILKAGEVASDGTVKGQVAVEVPTLGL